VNYPMSPGGTRKSKKTMAKRRRLESSQAAQKNPSTTIQQSETSKELMVYLNYKKHKLHQTQVAAPFPYWLPA
jgi:hypothetical protein